MVEFEHGISLQFLLLCPLCQVAKNRSKTILTLSREASRQQGQRDISSLRCYVYDPNKNLKCHCYIAVLICNDANIVLISSLNCVQN